MTAAPWKTLLASQLKSNIELQGVTAAYASLATVRPDNTPANRTVVFRGFAGEDHRLETGWKSELLVITSDKRSWKMKDIAANPTAELNWYMLGTQEQFRLHGRVHTVSSQDDCADLVRSVVKSGDAGSTADLATRAFLTRTQNGFNWQAERLRQWYRMDAHLRGTFTRETPQPLEIEDVDSTGWFVNRDPEKQRLLEVGYDNFVILLLEVEYMDYLKLPTGERYMHTQSAGHWVIRKLSG
ncbi:pyridoxamine 5'-phosphate oxidase-domain-containing protein [Fennellomyces sp. T-0311]|nr:pyridoxamine 5'-phosphate oxidase-domain-containing protein [Fennellomyces sp. T-0311]